mmetsp:Transcript_60278/g.161126  ORF Transcript_60278/g.161126 Transcript_60278/m.161126 type:complete len:100 (-) Transcript_60278:38-337(-)
MTLGPATALCDATAQHVIRARANLAAKHTEQFIYICRSIYIVQRQPRPQPTSMSCTSDHILVMKPSPLDSRSPTPKAKKSDQKCVHTLVVLSVSWRTFF